MDADPSSDNVTRPRWTRSSNGSWSPTRRRCWNRASSRSGRAASTSRSCPRERRARRPRRRQPTLRPRSSGCCSFRGPEIAALRRTGLLVRAGIGYDIIDVGAATDAGIWVANVPDYCVDEVADHALLLLLSALRRLTELERVWHAGAWVNASLVPPVHRIRGRRLGIVGFGRIGRAVAQRAHGFGFEVVAHDPLVARRCPPGGRRRAGRARRAVRDERCDHAPLPVDARNQVPRRRRPAVQGSSPGSSWSTPAAAASSTWPPSKRRSMTDGSRRWGWTSSTTNRSRT